MDDPGCMFNRREEKEAEGENPARTSFDSTSTGVRVTFFYLKGLGLLCVRAEAI